LLGRAAYVQSVVVNTTLPKMGPEPCGANSIPRVQLAAEFSSWPLAAQEVSEPPRLKFAAALIVVMTSCALPRFSITTSCDVLTEPVLVLEKVSEGTSETSTLRIRLLVLSAT